MTYISKYLTLEEYRCSCCGELPPDIDLNNIRNPYAELLDIFDAVRATWGKPIHVNSGYRCPRHNSSIGGSDCSVHMFGLALDMDMEDVGDVGELFHLLHMDFPSLRIGVYTQTGTFVHIDTGYRIVPRASLSWKKGARWYK